MIFFFKQKTAYEMRISDWSSDVCSSDLGPTFWSPHSGAHILEPTFWSPHSGAHILEIDMPNTARLAGVFSVLLLASLLLASPGVAAALPAPEGAVVVTVGGNIANTNRGAFDPDRDLFLKRSEEHTSELQSLMRISYAVFCLKKKK